MSELPPNQHPDEDVFPDDEPEEPSWLEELNKVDQEIRLERLKEEAGKLGEVEFADGEDLATEDKIAFLESIIEYDHADEATPLAHLRNIRVGVVPPDELDDEAATKELWRVIHGLARLGCYLHSTNHLSDVALYRALWDEFLRQPVVLLPDNPNFAFHLDFVDSGSEEDTESWLRYYASDETRRRWQEDFPGHPIPPKESPPFDRDRFLPQEPEQERDEAAGGEESDGGPEEGGSSWK